MMPDRVMPVGRVRLWITGRPRPIRRLLELAGLREKLDRFDRFELAGRGKLPIIVASRSPGSSHAISKFTTHHAEQTRQL